MRTPARILFERAGCPQVEKKALGSVEPLCFLCGLPCGTYGFAYDTAKTIPATFTDQFMAPYLNSPSTCAACIWAISGKPPLTLRLWSWVYRDDKELVTTHPKCEVVLPGVLACNKADLLEAMLTLLDPPAGDWFVVLADTGQVHCVPFAKMNRGAGPWVVRMEREDVMARPCDFARLLLVAIELLRAGFSWTDMETGEPAFKRVSDFGIANWWRAHKALRPHISGGLFRLAKLTLRKDYLDEVEKAARLADERGGDWTNSGEPHARHASEHQLEGRPAIGGLVTIENSPGGGSSFEPELVGACVDDGGPAPNRGARSSDGQLDLFAGLDF